MKMTSNTSKNITRIILIMVTIAPLAIDMYTPSLPSMSVDLHTTGAMMQLTVTAYLLTFSISQLFLGLFSDRFGRRPTLLCATPFFLLGSAICYFSSSVESVLIGRLIQGIGAGAFVMTCKTLIADCFEGRALHRMTSIYSIIYACVPVAAPLIGGFVQEYVNWEANFLIMFCLALAVYIFVYFKLPETHTPTEQHRLVLTKISKNYLYVLRNKRYMTAVCGCSLLRSAQMSFCIIAPFIVEYHLGFSPSVYGSMALIAGLGIMLGGVANTQLIKKFHPRVNIKVGLGITLISAIVFCLITSFLTLTLSLLIVPTFFLMFGSGIVYPIASSIGIAEIPELRGLSSALMGGLATFGVMLTTALLTSFHAQSPLTLALVYLCCSSLFICLLRFLAPSKNSQQIKL